MVHEKYQSLHLPTNNWILLISLVFSILCFVTIIINHNCTSVGDDYTANFSNSIILEASSASIVICVLPGLDLLLDILLDAVPTGKSKHASNNEVSTISVAIKLTNTEKFLFIIGVMSYSITIYSPFQELNSKSPAVAGNIFVSIGNVSAILTICPIMSLLYRVSTTWNSFTVMSISLMTCMSSFASSVCALYPSGSTANYALFLAASVLINLATLHFCITCCLSAFFSYKAMSSNIPLNGFFSDSLANYEALKTQIIRNYAIAAHLVATFIAMSVNSVWNWLYLDLTVEQVSIFIYFVVASATLTFLIEARVRKTEVTTALVSNNFFLEPIFPNYMSMIFRWLFLMRRSLM